MKYILIPNQVLKSKITDGAKLLYGLIYSIYRKGNRPVNVTNEWLAKKMDRKERRIRRYLEILRDNKLIFEQFERFSSHSVKRLIIPLVTAGQKRPIDTKKEG